jgi:hypothetical protein
MMIPTSTPATLTTHGSTEGVKYRASSKTP